MVAEAVVAQVGIRWCRFTVERRPTRQPPPTQNAGIDDIICRVREDVFSLTGNRQLAIVISHQHGINSQPPSRLPCTRVHRIDSTDTIKREFLSIGIAEHHSSRKRQSEVLVPYTVASHVDLACYIAAVGHLGHRLCLPSSTFHAWRQVSEAFVEALRALWSG